MIERTNMFFTVVTLSLTLTLSLFAFPMPAKADGVTYYVATNGSNTSPYDTWAKAATSIQTAINTADNGDTIIIGSSDGHGDGTYSENVDVNKQLTIQSENGYTTTTIEAANSSDHVFEVTDNNVTIDGFSIYGATGIGKAGIYLASVTNCTIKNNRCGWDGTHNNKRGIHLNSSTSCTIDSTIANYNSGEGIYLNSSSDNNNITSNTANYNSADGISLASSSNNTLNDNTVSNNSMDGFHLVPSCNDNTLENNTVGNNGQNGILMVSCSNNNLTNNTVNNNSGIGIYLYGSSNNTMTGNDANYDQVGIKLESSSSGNELTSNTVTHNEFGIFLSESSNNTITSNTMNENDGRWDGDGIMLSGSSNNTISNNTANNDPGDGIEFYNSSNNTVMGNTLDNSALSNPGASMRINYYSSNNTIIDNTVINGTKGIVLEEESNYNFVSNNTITGHSDDGFEFWENASNNTLAGNNISNNGRYGIWLPSGSNNTIYLNNLIDNTDNNVYSESSTTTWHSPTKLYYDFNSGTFHKGYLGNYYSDGTHTGSYGIGNTSYTIANDNDDDYQLIQTSGNYSLQAWWLHSDNQMYRDNMTKAGGSITISGGGSDIWIADQAALMDISFSGSDTWTGQLVFTSAPTAGHTFTVEIGASTDGSDFTAGGPDATLTGDGSMTGFTFATDASAFTVSTGKYLALKVTNNNAGSDYTVQTGGAWSYTSSPESSVDYSLPVELTSFTAESKSGAVLLKWTTESETKNLGFIIERMAHKSWQKIASYKTDAALQGHGSVSERHDYQYLDKSVLPGSTYTYRIADVDYSGRVTWDKEVEVKVEIDKYDLHAAFPNPFNPATTISYQITETCKVELNIYDMRGRLVKRLVNDTQNAGTYKVIWHGLDKNNSQVGNGVYFYQMTTNTGFSKTGSVIFLK